ncbi:MAG TPA: DUF3710 domain-containing protein [Mycobacteriales bacterium]|nr:DUF3710 domain-containing protein [Mycobacteriales bacterium]
MFRRRREADETEEVTVDEARADDVALDDVADADDEQSDEETESPPAAPVDSGPTTGPWDAADVPKDDPTPRVDLGGLAVPIPDGIELRVEVAEEVVVAAALVDGASQLVVNAFAAPRSAGLWDDVRREIAESLTESGGTAEHTAGTFGTELRARIPGESGGGQPARFVGVDGPRWFLRGLLTGAAATDVAQGRRLEEVFRGIVVVRGNDAMAPRDPLPLHLPREVMEQAVEKEPEAEEAPRLQLRERGPEITEIQ